MDFYQSDVSPVLRRSHRIFLRHDQGVVHVANSDRAPRHLQMKDGIVRGIP